MFPSTVTMPAGTASPKVGSPSLPSSTSPPLHLYTPSLFTPSVHPPPFTSPPSSPPSLYPSFTPPLLHSSPPSLFTFLSSIPSPSTLSLLHPSLPSLPHRISQLAPWWNREGHLVSRLSTLLPEIRLHEATQRCVGWRCVCVWGEGCVCGCGYVLVVYAY